MLSSIFPPTSIAARDSRPRDIGGFLQLLSLLLRCWLSSFAAGAIIGDSIHPRTSSEFLLMVESCFVGSLNVRKFSLPQLRPSTAASFWQWPQDILNEAGSCIFSCCSEIWNGHLRPWKYLTIDIYKVEVVDFFHHVWWFDHFKRAFFKIYQ